MFSYREKMIDVMTAFIKEIDENIHASNDRVNAGLCVGVSTSMAKAILNGKQQDFLDRMAWIQSIDVQRAKEIAQIYKDKMVEYRKAKENVDENVLIAFTETNSEIMPVLKQADDLYYFIHQTLFFHIFNNPSDLFRTPIGQTRIPNGEKLSFIEATGNKALELSLVFDKTQLKNSLLLLKEGDSATVEFKSGQNVAHMTNLYWDNEDLCLFDPEKGVIKGIDAVVNAITQYHTDINISNSNMPISINYYTAGNVSAYPSIETVIGTLNVDLNKRDNRDEYTALFQAVGNNQAKMVKELLRLQENTPLSKGWHPIHFAVDHNNPAILDIFVKDRPALIEELTVPQGMTPLHLACAMGRVNAINILIEQGADLKAISKDGKTPLHYATEQSNSDIIIQLIIGDPSLLNSKDNNDETPLHHAIQSNNLAATDTLIKKEALLNETNKNGETPLHLAVKKGNSDIIKILLDNNVNLKIEDKDGLTPIHRATKEGKLDIIKALLEKEDLTLLKDGKGKTLLEHAIDSGNINTIKFIIEKYVEKNAPLMIGEEYLLHHLIKNKKSTIAIDIIDSVVTQINLADNETKTPLDLAMSNHDANLVACLAKKGVELNISGETIKEFLVKGDAHEKAYEICMMYQLPEALPCNTTIIVKSPEIATYHVDFNGDAQKILNQAETENLLTGKKMKRGVVQDVSAVLMSLEAEDNGPLKIPSVEAAAKIKLQSKGCPFEPNGAKFYEEALWNLNYALKSQDEKTLIAILTVMANHDLRENLPGEVSSKLQENNPFGGMPQPIQKILYTSGDLVKNDLQTQLRKAVLSLTDENTKVALYEKILDPSDRINFLQVLTCHRPVAQDYKSGNQAMTNIKSFKESVQKDLESIQERRNENIQDNILQVIVAEKVDLPKQDNEQGHGMGKGNGGS